MLRLCFTNFLHDMLPRFWPTVIAMNLEAFASSPSFRRHCLGETIPRMIAGGWWGRRLLASLSGREHGAG